MKLVKYIAPFVALPFLFAGCGDSGREASAIEKDVKAVSSLDKSYSPKLEEVVVPASPKIKTFVRPISQVYEGINPYETSKVSSVRFDHKGPFNNQIHSLEGCVASDCASLKQGTLVRLGRRGAEEVLQDPNVFVRVDISDYKNEIYGKLYSDDLRFLFHCNEVCEDLGKRFAGAIFPELKGGAWEAVEYNGVKLANGAITASIVRFDGGVETFLASNWFESH